MSDGLNVVLVWLSVGVVRNYVLLSNGLVVAPLSGQGRLWSRQPSRTSVHLDREPGSRGGLESFAGTTRFRESKDAHNENARQQRNVRFSAFKVVLDRCGRLLEHR